VTDWSADDLDTVGAADELQISSPRSDGSLRPYVTIWVVRVGDELYVLSWRGGSGAWFRQAMECGAGRIRAGGLQRDVMFSEPDDAVGDAIDQAYRAKYGRYGNTYVDPMVGPDAKATTLRLIAP
jgi:hypothetical protein